MALLTINIERKPKEAPSIQQIDDNTYFRYFYLPYVIMDVFYDYVDTIINLSVQLRIEPMKKVTRLIRQLRADYEYLKKRYLTFNNIQEISEHLEIFVDHFSKELENEYKLIKWKVSGKRKQLLPDWQFFVASVYMGLAIYSALSMYVGEADREIEKIWKNSSRSLMPEMLPQTLELLKEYLGDCQVLEQDDINSSGHRIIKLIKEIRFE